MPGRGIEVRINCSVQKKTAHLIDFFVVSLPSTKIASTTESLPSLYFLLSKFSVVNRLSRD